MLNVRSCFFQENGQWFAPTKNGPNGRTKAEVYDCDAPDCQNQFVRLPAALKKYDKKFCSKACANRTNKGTLGLTGEKSSGWKGGRRKNSDGYIYLLKPDHPNANKDGCVFEHRYVIEQKLGRLLDSSETVHHINGKRDDNRIENLELWCSRHPKGTRVEDLVKWAKEILSIYEGEF